ncbi:hypothetical protein D3C85_1671690 [compost metagenome]
MTVRIGFGHQRRDVAPDQLITGIAEGSYRRRIHRADYAAVVDHDHAVDRCREHGQSQLPAIELNADVIHIRSLAQINFSNAVQR